VRKIHKPFISIIIPMRNAERTLKACLDSLVNLNYPKSKLEIILLDGMSTDKSRQIASEYNVKLISNPKISIASGRNLGFHIAKGDLIAFTDADCMLDRNWLANSIKYFDDSSVAGITGPIRTPSDQNSFAKAVAFLFSLSVSVAGSTHKENQANVREVDDFPTCNAIYRREALNKVMPLDEDLFSGSDMELNIKLRRLGYKLLAVPDVVVWHYKRETPKAFLRQVYRYGIGRLQIGKKFGRINLVHFIVGLALPLLMSFILMGVAFSAMLLWIVGGLSLAGLFFINVLSLARTKSIKIACLAPLALIVLVFGWSCGFLRELLFPVKGPRVN